MSKHEEIRTRISEILGKPVEEIQDSVAFVDLGVESFTLINMVIDLQETFKIRLNQEDLVQIHKIGDLIGLISSRIK